MEPQIEQAAQQAIETMRRNLGGKAEVDDLTRTAILGKFHFSRVFHRAIGLSPGYFLSAATDETTDKYVPPVTVTGQGEQSPRWLLQRWLVQCAFRRPR